MVGEGDWLTWPQAAELVGCPVPTIDWHTRTGRIERRPHAGRRPSVSRRSVEEFANWYREQQASKAKRKAHRKQREQLRRRHRARAVELGIRPGRIPPFAPDSTGWLITSEAAAIVGVSKATLTRLTRDGTVKAVKVGSRWWLDEDSVRQLAGGRSLWVSFADAAEIVGCSETAIKNAVRAGTVRQRQVHRTRPSLDRGSVVEFAAQWTGRQELRAERAQREPMSGPPDDGDVWLDSAATALLLGLSRTRVGQLARADQLPSVRRGQRRWFRRSDVEQAAAARANSR